MWYGDHYESHITLFGANSLDFAMLFPSLLWVASKQINQKFIAEWSFQMLTLPSKIFQGCHISILKRGHHNFKCVLCIICCTGHHIICSLFTIMYTNLDFTEGQMDRPPVQQLGLLLLFTNIGDRFYFRLLKFPFFVFNKSDTFITCWPESLRMVWNFHFDLLLISCQAGRKIMLFRFILY